MGFESTGGEKRRSFLAINMKGENRGGEEGEEPDINVTPDLSYD